MIIQNGLGCDVVKWTEAIKYRATESDQFAEAFRASGLKYRFLFH